MQFYPGFDILPLANPLGFWYGKDVFGPEPEYRKLESIRHSLLDPHCEGPDPVYGIAMDIGKSIHKNILHETNLLFGAVAYAKGQLGNEPVRSQGHVHKKTRDNLISTPEIYEIWSGKAIVYMQEYTGDHPGRCFAIEANPGDVVVVPPDWAHATISADPFQPLSFGAWCDRNYGFEYDAIKSHHGLAWYPIYTNSQALAWKANQHYLPSKLIQKKPGNYFNLDLESNEPIYLQFEKNPQKFLWVSKPALKENIWKTFEP